MDNGASSYRRFLEGDESAFDEIMKELFDGLVFFIDRYVHDIHAAEDIAIDAFSDLVVNKHRYNFKVTLKTYLFMLGRSRALNYIKRRKIIDFVELSESEKVSTELEALEETVLKNERKRIVNNALDSLPDDMRVVIHLIYFEDHSYAEFNGFDNDDKYRLMDISARGSNRDGAALRYVAEALSKRSEAVKLLILVSDGQPADTGYYGTAAEEDLRGIKQEYQRKGILFVAAAIGNDKQNIERIYGDSFLDITDLNQLPTKLTGVVKRHIRV